MKKYLMCALILCAIPAVAAAQVEVNCESCTHEVSVYMGEGGFIATADEDAKMVTWVSSCGGVTVSGELTPNDDGTVSALFTMDNGLACMDEKGGTFQLGPITDGGWFWITDDMNSAVGGLVAKDVLKNDMATITNAGDGVTMMAGKGAVYLKETSSGRVGILPNILPEPPMAPAAICGPRASRSWPYEYNAQQVNSCMLGGGGTKIRLTGPAAHGRTGMIGDAVTRPATGEPLMLKADLWLDETGSYSTNADGENGAPTAPSIRKGWAGKTASGRGPGDGMNWLTDVEWTVHLHGGGPLADATGAGVTIGDSDADGQAEISIASNPSYCPAIGAQTTATVIIAAGSSGPADIGGVNEIHPGLRSFTRGNAPATVLVGQHAGISLSVMCPPRSSANQGTELVPDNPFPPTTE